MISKKVISTVPRLSLERHPDLTYRRTHPCRLWEAGADRAGEGLTG